MLLYFKSFVVRFNIFIKITYLKVIMKYMLYVDGNPIQVVNSLKEAKQLATRHITDRKLVKIESFVAPAPSKIWIYDIKVESWVEES